MSEQKSNPDVREYTVPDYVSLSEVRDGTVVLITPSRTRELHGSSVQHLKRVFERLRDGGSVETLSKELDVPREKVQMSFATLDELDVLESASADTATDSVAWISDEGMGQSSDEPTVAVHNEFDGVDLPRFDGVTVTERETLDGTLNAESTDLLLTVTPAVQPAYHRRVLDECTSRDTPWLPLRFAGDEIRIGPLQHSEVEGCFDCHYRRFIRSVDRPQATLARNQYVEASGNAIPYVREVVRLGLVLALTQVRRFLDERGSVTVDGSVLYVDLERMTTELGEVIPVSGCQVCEQS